jgi:hypothetical protein
VKLSKIRSAPDSPLDGSVDAVDPISTAPSAPRPPERRRDATGRNDVIVLDQRGVDRYPVVLPDAPDGVLQLAATAWSSGVANYGPGTVQRVGPLAGDRRDSGRRQAGSVRFVRRAAMLW